jgi:uncharacterized Fe-S center protein
MVALSSNVYFTNLRAKIGETLPSKLDRLIAAAGFDTIEMNERFAAIKVHFGEAGNLAYLRPNYARVIVERVRKLGGKPFLTDCATLYVGRRKNALDHLEVAYENGYNPFATGCHVIIGDGVKGTDEALVPVADGEYVKEAKIGRAIMDADVFISLNHFKGHEGAGFGGALKNIGMGCGSRAGKMEMHNAGKPIVFQDACRKCGVCARQCAHGAISFPGGAAHIDQSKCAGCGRCIGACAFDAVAHSWDEAEDVMTRKMAEYAAAVLRGRPSFHVNLVIDVSPNCDCHSENDMPIIPDVGFLASFDPVALDQASVDLANSMPIVKGSANDHEDDYEDHFVRAHPNTNWRVCLAHAEKLGLGTRKYALVTV